MIEKADRKLYSAEDGDFSMALIGDVMLNRRISHHAEPQFLKLREILRTADTTFANLETVVRNEDEGTPTLSYATYTTMPPEMLNELKWLGISLLSAANNHAYDFNEGGVLATIAHLERAGLAYAGLGRNLTKARAPAYFDTRNGRVGLVAATTTFYPWSRAGFKVAYRVPPEQLAVLREISAALGFAKESERKRKHFYSDKEAGGGRSEEVHLLGATFGAADQPSFAGHADPADLAGNMKWIREARRQADWVVASIHSHDFAFSSVSTANRQSEMTDPIECVREFACKAIDEGADIVVGHGSHTVLGIEIYKGRPILYGVGNCLFQNETITAFPADSYERFDLSSDATPADFLDARTDKDRKGHPSDPAFWEGVAVVCDFQQRNLKRIALHPVDVGFGRPRAQRGRAVLADGALAQKIIDRIAVLSKPFGTVVTRSGNTGFVEVE
ncbi:MAG: CapA family protein [Alphaproteobacteria bacterium]|nr:CapA family protein [Alphaproteobacteria bacterium]